MTKKIYQIQISLNYFKAKIWRRLLIPSDLLLSDFHKIIQTSMGWTNSHLHQF
ncbi:MAG: plasmid pRiA4b ORF-3 family protein, partial [Candidatus Marinimicrobia bacterium]|nr:plasmid pRiA4b ORF-3 family protein [Candidatus Neomarinimicrobiota bacterium]